ncbi:uncharacterized protein LOC8059223 isoform X2 [Sorghum bicolor]|uniref:RING-type domain-containing protein n=1 Tax=Sorghum bicolor TaxID=4558 RepID=C5Y2M4_SORBI|nr:uncharacterized protein LOC8059223 isoform X2 [Sorghum bicolor]EES07837.2 hypothetical protein SORBI_3005G001000 [Sorghum bicolor]|eukprot:XP_021317280.1 uncharacterized protein LOC8059223 isoform X2 [Sorghum bicolor]
MTTMSDDGDRTCPLCAEEMDITDQQLKPCKCGYDICVWCWHHIIDMAEKEETEGRCPACRTRYDKDRIVKMAATCDRTVAEKNVEKKHKTQKVKPKAAPPPTTMSTVESKKHLASVRVIQRNLVYIIGLPAHLCNESVLERREYFGQYGKVLKVSVSRPTGPPSQASANSNISVYITYAKEEEAIRCIQAVHNFVLEGKVLRACFGTTKYCHAWLRNMTCGNPDCLYLHDVGSQEDSFTKDEIISAYTRTRVPQMASSVSQRRTGTVLPPPGDDFSYSAVVSAKHTFKNGTLNTTNQPRLSPPNSSSGRSTLPPAASWGQRDLTARTTATGATSSQSHTKPKSESQSNPFSSSSVISSTKTPSSWNDDTSTATKMSEGQQVSEKESKTLQPYKPGISKETQALSSLESSLDIDFSTIPSAWNDDDIVVSDGMSKGSDENQVANENGKLTHPASKSLVLSKKDITMNNITSKSPSDVSSLAISKSDVSTSDGDHSLTNITPKSLTSNATDCQSSHAAGEKILEDIASRNTEMEKLSAQIRSVKLGGNNDIQSMAGNQQSDSDVMSCTPVDVPMDQNFDKDQSHLNLNELFLPSENKDTILSCQYSSDKRLSSSEPQNCSVASLNDTVDSTMLTDKLQSILLDGSKQPSYSSFAQFPSTLDSSLWNDTESNPALTIGTRASLTGFSSINNTYVLPNGGQDGLGTVYTHGNVSGYPGIGSHQHTAMGSDSIGGFDKTISVNKDESRIISDMLSSEFNPWDDSYSTANNFVRMLRESENNDVHFTAPSWKSVTGSKESRFSFARQDNQGNLLDSSLRNCGTGTEQNFSLLPQNSRGNIYQNGLAFQSLENDFSNSYSLGVLDMATAGTSRSKISAPPGFSAPARAPPPGFSSAFPSQDSLNPTPGFPSGISSHDGSIPLPRFSAFSSGISAQEVSKPPTRLPSPFSSGFSSQDGPNTSSRFPSAFSSGLPSHDGPNPPSRFPSAFSSGFSSQDGSNQSYGSTYQDNLLQDTVLGGNSNHYQSQFGRHASDMEFDDPAILAVGKGLMPGIGDSGLEMKNSPAFQAQLQPERSDPRFQLHVQPNVQSHQNLRFTDPMQDGLNHMNDNYLASRFLAQNHDPISPYAQIPQQPRNSQLTNGHWDGWSDSRQGNNTAMSGMSRMLYPSEVNKLHMLGSNDIYNRAFGM